jgi:hypothetical protein
VFENRVLRRMSAPKREEVAGGRRTLHNEELHNLYASPNVIRVIRSMRILVGRVAHMGEMRSVYVILVGKLEDKRPLVRPKRRWEDNIKMGLTEKGRECVYWLHLAHNAFGRECHLSLQRTSLI